ncbi:hypothetical protein Mal64_33110 [Pseudobythopirellula maris]|uniref:Pectate lyase n=1 Tax=Pseudobythopirellula maris TaxID=2527991 RepID=A0A5C5ZGY7_9BACT|nr:thrombospondin type 3 repeat-containing protein [Pseudobythopirellula maris]TWT86486.1 hypothetical protein Mal64_33110 [Pseudobythopirellula maris]
MTRSLNPTKAALAALLAAALMAMAPLIAAAERSQPAAFPGALGQGALSLGGRGGDVYHVTTLDDYAPHKGEKKIEGSLRHAIRSAEAPRTIVFDVAGPIALREPIAVRKNRITIAGQTSPGGVTLWGYPMSVSDGAHDVVLRHLRLRCGDFNTVGALEARDTGGGDLKGSDANSLAVYGNAERVILDHLSAAWGVDETLSVTVARDVTVQHCLIADSLNHSFHKKGAHGYGSLVRGECTPQDQAAGRGGYTFYGCLWAHHRARSPAIGGQQRLDDGQSERDRRAADVNVVNCVVYNWSGLPTSRSELGEVRLNLVGNDYLTGPSKRGEYVFRGTDSGATLVYQQGNRFDRQRDKDYTREMIDTPAEIADCLRLEEGERLVDAPMNFFSAVAPHVLPVDIAHEQVSERVGASLWRDTLDREAIRTLRDRDGAPLDSQEDLRDADGRLPGVDDLTTAARPEGFDTDRDGMADAFETAHGLDPTDPEDRNGTELGEADPSLAGFTNLEIYLDAMTRSPQPY